MIVLSIYAAFYLSGFAVGKFGSGNNLTSSSTSTNHPSPTAPAQTSAFQFETVKLDAIGKVIEIRKGEARYFSEDLDNGVTVDMVMIPGGTFTMGSPDNEASRIKDEGPQHEVTVSAFAMGKYEVTQRQWKAVAALPKINIDLNPDPSKFKGNNLSVEQVSWEEAKEFCGRLSAKTGRTYRLPTEAEWEYACRSGTATPFAFGATITLEIANYYGDQPFSRVAKGYNRQKTVEVGTLGKANAFGLYDMHGNVWEWCEDWYGSYSSGEQTDPKGPTTGYLGVYRGGAWSTGAAYARSAVRIWNTPSASFDGLGFRLVMTYN